MLSKLRFISAQLEAYLSDDLWLANARAANRAAARLADGLAAVDGVRLEGVGVPPDVEVEIELPYAGGADPQLEAALDVLLEQVEAADQAGD